MKSLHKVIILAVLAAITTVFGVSDGINWFQAGYGITSFVACLILPILLWVVTIYFYRKYKKDKTR